MWAVPPVFVAVIMYTIHVSTLCVLTVMCSICAVATVSVPSVTEHCILPFHLCKVCLCVLDCYWVRWSCQVHIGDTVFPSAQLKHKRLSANTNHPLALWVGTLSRHQSLLPPPSSSLGHQPLPQPDQLLILLVQSYYMDAPDHSV